MRDYEMRSPTLDEVPGSAEAYLPVNDQLELGPQARQAKPGTSRWECNIVYLDLL